MGRHDLVLAHPGANNEHLSVALFVRGRFAECRGILDRLAEGRQLSRGEVMMLIAASVFLRDLDRALALLKKHEPPASSPEWPRHQSFQRQARDARQALQLLGR